MGVKHSYIDKFDILHPFKSSAMQDVFIGAPKENNREIVLINVIKGTDGHIKKTMGQMKKSLENLLHYEEVDQGAVLVTRYREGIPLLTYVEQESLSLGSRIHIMFQYLKKIVKYDLLPNEIKEILIDETQIIIDQGEVNLYELILFHDEESETTMDRDTIQEIGKTLKKILTIGAENTDFHKGHYQQIYRFISEIEEGKHSYKNLLSVFNGFKNIYFHGESKENGYISRLNNEGIKRKIEKNQGNILSGKQRTVIITFIAISLAIYGGLMAVRHISVDNTMSQPPTAYFEKIQTKDGFDLINKSEVDGDDNEIRESLWEIYKEQKIIEKVEDKDLHISLKAGEIYHVTLTVKDQLGRWSKPYGKDIYVENQVSIPEGQESADVFPGKLQDLVAWDNPEKNIVVDKTVFRSGTYSLKIDNDGDKATILIKELEPEPYALLSFWIMSSSFDTIGIQIEGSFQGNQSLYRKIDFKPKETFVWEMIQLPEIMEEVQELKVVFSDIKESIWIDDIEFSAYK